MSPRECGLWQRGVVGKNESPSELQRDFFMEYTPGKMTVTHSPSVPIDSCVRRTRAAKKWPVYGMLTYNRTLASWRNDWNV